MSITELDCRQIDLPLLPVVRLHSDPRGQGAPSPAAVWPTHGRSPRLADLSDKCASPAAIAKTYDHQSCTALLGGDGGREQPAQLGMGVRPWKHPGTSPCTIMMVFGLPRTERPQVCRRGVPRRGQRLQDAVQLRHLDGREVPARRLGVRADLLRGGGAGNDAAHLGVGQ
jgi:hypothetical protein